MTHPLLLAAANGTIQAEPLNRVGATIMVVSVAFVTLLTVACYRRILAPTRDDG